MRLFSNPLFMFLSVITALFSFQNFSHQNAIRSTLPIERDTNNSKKHDLSILTLNTWGLPIWYPKSDKKTRYKDIAAYTKSLDVDIAVFQEVWDRTLAKTMLNAIPNSYHYKAEYDCARKVHGIVKMDCYGGLMTWTRHPIVYERFVMFPIEKHMKLEEKVGEKGVLITTIVTPKCTLNIINTHLYSGHKAEDEDFRLGQVKFIKSVIEQDDRFKKYPTVLAGDLNIQHPSTLPLYGYTEAKVYDYINQELRFDDFDTHISDDEFTYDKDTNHYAPDHALRQKLDYVMARSCMGNCLNEVAHKVVCNKDKALSDHSGFVSFLTVDATSKVSDLDNTIAAK